MASDRYETILIHSGRVYRHDGDTDDPAIEDVLIKDGKFARIEPGLRTAHESGDLGHVDRVINAERRLLLPGFFNAHYHSHDTLQKGCFETLTLDHWGAIAMPHAYGRRSHEELRVRTLVGALECIRSGITTVQDMTSLNPFNGDDLDVVLDTYEEIGLRCVFAPQFANVGRMNVRAFYKDLIPEDQIWRLSGPGRQFPEGTDIIAIVEQAIVDRLGKRKLVTFGIGPSSPESCSRDLWEKIADLSARRDLPVYTHIYENKGMTHIARTAYGDSQGSLIRYLGESGVLGPRLTLAHSVWLLPEEIDTIGQTRTNVALNPIGNLKTRSGIAPVRALLDAGINVGIGCDNCSCSDVQNMFQAMKLYTTLPGVCDPVEGPPYAKDAIRAATIGGARSTGRTDLGEIAVGMRADLSIIDLRDISYVPLNSVARQLVYTEGGRAVESVIIDGRAVMIARRVLTVDEDALYREVAAVMPDLLSELAKIRDRLSPVRPYIVAAEARTWDTDIGVDRFLSRDRRP
jgi:5-methylthioadenosine/S-adenosylhomocysteine deaminase